MKETVAANEFKNTTLTYVQKKGQACLFLLLDTLKDLDNEEFMPASLAGDDRIQKIKAFAAELALSLDELIDQGAEAAKAALVLVEENKAALVAIAKSIYTYEHALTLTGDLITQANRRFSAAQMNEEDAQLINPNRLVEDCMAYVDAEEISSPESIRKAEMLACFPLRMARLKFNAYIEDSLSEMLPIFSEKDTDRFIETLKLRFYPFATETYGKDFLPFKEKMERAFFAETDVLDEEGFDALWDEADGTAKEIADTLYYLEMLSEPLIFLTVLLSYVEDLDMLFDNNLVYKDLYYTFKENFRTENFELIVDQFSKNLEESLETVLDEGMDLEKRVERQMSRFTAHVPDE
jgi:hypothetical protein